MTSCQYEEAWARAFTLADFGISTSDQFLINSAQVAISNSYDGARLVFNFYSLTSEAPTQNPQRISYGNLVLAPEIGDTPEIVQIDFPSPVTVPAGVEKILVEVTQMDDIYNDDYKEVLIAGTEFDNDVSWFKGCREHYTHISTEDLSPSVPDANFFINVTGTKVTQTNVGTTTTLTNNSCGDLVKTSMFSCSYSKLYWARLFNLEDFGVSTNEELTINFGQIGITSSDSGTGIQFNIYEVDENFPASFSETNLIGSSQVQRLPNTSDHHPQIITVNFENPITVPSNVTRILVEVTNVIYWGSGVFFVAGTEEDVGDSWFRGCGSGSPGYSQENYVTMVDPTFRKDGGYPDAKFYINVTGDVQHVTNNFSMNISNSCSEFLKEFSVAPVGSVSSVVWDFGDPASGADNTSTNLSPFHDFTADGTYTITATVTGNDGTVEVVTETIESKEPPNAYGIDDLYSCEDVYGSGISSSFDVSQTVAKVLGGQNNMIVTFIDGSGNEYETLPNPFTNTVRDRETIVVRVAHANNLCCYSETTFDLIVHPIPDLSSVTDLFVCSNGTDGFSTFDLEQVQNIILADNTAASVSFYRADSSPIGDPLNAVENLVANEEVITVQVMESVNNCTNEASFRLMVNPLPMAYEPEVLIGCDDNGDGISEYFDTSNVESQVTGGQSGLTVSYFDGNGNVLPSPLPNPYTNTISNEETITVRVTNEETHCYEETQLLLRTSSQPQLNRPQPIYACDFGNGFAEFDLSHIEAEILGSQTGLVTHFFQEDGVELPNPLPSFYENTAAWNQTLLVRVENELNNSCYSETSIDLVVTELPSTALLEETYFICGLEPSLAIQIETDFEYYQWTQPDGSVISNAFETELTSEGMYTLTIGQTTNGLYCENHYEFELVRSELPTIVEIKRRELSTDNYIEIIASGDGDFEYSIDGVVFQDSNYFPNILGGNYTVMVRDKKGCGEDSQQVTLIDYPRFFTPNNDGFNEYWQIFGIEAFPDAQVYIFDRYGKLLAQLRPEDEGWDGFFNGREMISNDYWFRANLGEGTIFSGHFTLKR